MHLCRYMQFPEIHTLRLINLSDVKEKDNHIVANFFEFSAPKKLAVLVLDNRIHDMSNVFEWNIADLMLRVDHTICFTYFYLTEQQLKYVIENSRNTENLTLDI